VANANAVALCPSCHVELPSPIPPVCPQCAHTIAKPSNPFFDSPDYLHYQLGDKLGEFEGGEKQITPAQMEARKSIEAAYREWGRDAPPGDRLAAMKDAHHLLSWMLHSDMSDPTTQGMFSAITAIGKSIGDLSKSIETFFASGGAPNVTTPRRVQALTGDDNRGQANPS